MNKKMQLEIDKEIEKMCPSSETVCIMMSRHEFKQTIRKCITNGVLIGYSNAVKFTCEKLKSEYKDLENENLILREKVKDLEMEICYKT
ncbi:MAG: hypothetical protein EBR47_03705 [Betaproteobacteria bacterium]|nr:hypothetical protein [Betaproteobacteria bacterium]